MLGWAQDGKALLESHCTKCHDLTSTLRQRNTRERWTKIVEDMIGRGAEGTDEEFDKITDYLVKHQGPKVAVNKASADELSTVAGLTKANAAAIVQHREKNGAFKTLDDLKAIAGIDWPDVEAKKENLEFIAP